MVEEIKNTRFKNVDDPKLNSTFPPMSDAKNINISLPLCHAAAGQPPHLYSTHPSQSRSSRTAFAPLLSEAPHCHRSQEPKSYPFCQPGSLCRKSQTHD